MSASKPSGPLRPFSQGIYIDSLSRLFRLPSSNQTELIANSPDEFFYERLFLYIDDHFRLTPLGDDFRRDLDARIKTLIGRRVK